MEEVHKTENITDHLMALTDMCDPEEEEEEIQRSIRDQFVCAFRGPGDEDQGFDDVNGEPLDPRLVKRARQE